MTWKKKIAGTGSNVYIRLYFYFTGIVDRYEFN